ncbi:MAG TPA: hypothetical protein DDX84_04520 [Nitrospiraceae bacterium]|nr:MAG: hypothetical protein A3D21_05800 [Nitrospirae bacterium RIFCSPHIGHO2_02_FULL_42_12]HAS16334.1 hypothetical protein [Nitrospiraceae bacterium]HBI23466.1 hypothetical protein [Nitrospiraceae bacterium]
MITDPKHPHLVVIGGPNGAGKSTMAPSLLKGTLEVTGAEPRLIAYGEKEEQLVVRDKTIWHNIKKRYGKTKRI